MNVNHVNMYQLESGLNQILNAPKDNGIVQMIVCRPKIEVREILKVAKLDKEFGSENIELCYFRHLRLTIFPTPNHIDNCPLIPVGHPTIHF